MPLKVIIASLIAILATGALYWAIALWPKLGARSFAAPLGKWQSALVQLPTVFILLALLGQDASALLAILSPPIGLLMMGREILGFLGFAWPLLFGAGIMSLTTMVAATRAAKSHSKLVSLIALFAGAVTFLAVGEVRLRFLQNLAIDRLEPDCVVRKLFVNSFATAHGGFQTGYHTSVQVKEVVYGWSYKTLNFYRVPESVAPNLQRPCEIQMSQK